LLKATLDRVMRQAAAAGATEMASAS